MNEFDPATHYLGGSSREETTWASLPVRDVSEGATADPYIEIDLDVEKARDVLTRSGLYDGQRIYVQARDADGRVAEAHIARAAEILEGHIDTHFSLHVGDTATGVRLALGIEESGTKLDGVIPLIGGITALEWGVAPQSTIPGRQYHDLRLPPQESNASGTTA